MKADALRIYWVVTFRARGRSPISFTGTNARRDALRLAARDGGAARRMTGAEWSALAELELRT